MNRSSALVTAVAVVLPGSSPGSGTGPRAAAPPRPAATAPLDVAAIERTVGG